MTTRHALVPGSIVTARPWVMGTEREPQLGYVLTIHPSCKDTRPGYDGYVLMWFPGLGGMSPDVIGYAIQPILGSRTLESGLVSGLRSEQVANLALMAQKMSGDPDVAPFYQVLLRALKG